MQSTRFTALSLVVGTLALATSCNAILGTGDYEIGAGGSAPANSSSDASGATTSVSDSSSSSGAPSSTSSAGGDTVSSAASGGGGGAGGGTGGGPPAGCDVPVDDRPVVSIEGEITENQLLTCDKVYKLTGEVFVEAPATIEIQAGTVLFGDKATGAALVIRPGAKILANGEPDRPIVFTSQGGEFADPGDWGGLVLLGLAPTNIRDGKGNPTQGTVEGILDAANAKYGGDDPDDSSGSLQYVRVEYGGKAIAPNNELNGITFAGVGRGTIVDHVQVRQTTDDCFEFFGGTVDAKHLVCQAPGDDGFDWDNGFSGRLQFIVLQQDIAYTTPQDMNGFEGDNDAAGDQNAPLSSPTIFNATLCGQDYGAGQQYGMLLRKATQARIGNAYVSGFEAGVDFRNTVDPEVDVTSSVFFGNTLVAYPENAAAPYDDDDTGFDEIDYLETPARDIAFDDVDIPGCDDMLALDLAPPEAITENAEAPPDDDFFDPDAAYVGAFSGPDDDWTAGSWVVWSNN